MKEKIEGILDINGAVWTPPAPKNKRNALKELSTLIQEERKDLEKYLAKVIKQLEEEEKELCKAFRKIDDLEIRLKIERKEAVRGLIEYLEVNTEKVFYLGCGKMINEYLGIVESEGKE
jgi:L-lactate utilization protein LutB